MQLKAVGEFGLIELLAKNSICNPTTVVKGIGDDAAVLRGMAGRLQLVTADMLVEGVHFDLRTTTAVDLGYKAIAINLSDIAAMGGTPLNAVVSIALPQTIEVEFVVELYDGMKRACREAAVNIVGGDTTSSPSGVIINVTMLGEARENAVVYRSGAKPGEVIAVTNFLGTSAAGLELLQTGQFKDEDFAVPIIKRHLLPQAQHAVGSLLARFVSSMDDISDGLASELHEIAAASAAGMRVDEASVPIMPQVRHIAALFNKNPLDYALYGGEDFQLLFTITEEQFIRLRRELPEIMLTAIGEVTARKGEVELVKKDGTVELIYPRGYNHFRHD